MILEIIKKFQGYSVKPDLYHFRTHGKAEVDLIIKYNRILHPIEIKWQSNPSKKDVRGFQSLKEVFPHERIGRRLLICNTEKPYSINPEVLRYLGGECEDKKFTEYRIFGFHASFLNLKNWITISSLLNLCCIFYFVE